MDTEPKKAKFGSSSYDRFIKFDPLIGRFIDNDAITEAGLPKDEIKAAHDRLARLALADLMTALFKKSSLSKPAWEGQFKKGPLDGPELLTTEQVARLLGLDPKRPDFDKFFANPEMAQLDRPDRLSPQFLAERYRRKTERIADEIKKISPDVLSTIHELMRSEPLGTTDETDLNNSDARVELPNLYADSHIERGLDLLNSKSAVDRTS